MIMDDQIWRAV